MAYDNYGSEDGMNEETTASKPSEEGNDKEESMEDEGRETALLPKSFFRDEMKVGDTETIKVVRAYEDDYEVECYYEGDEKEGDSSKRESEMDKAQSGLDKLAM